jgi:hypothetical protein
MLNFSSKDFINVCNVLNKQKVCSLERHFKQKALQENFVHVDLFRNSIQSWLIFNPVQRIKSILAKKSDVGSFLFIFDDDEILKNVKFFYSKCLGDKNVWVRKPYHKFKPVLMKKQAGLNKHTSKMQSSFCLLINIKLSHLEPNQLNIKY